MELTIYKTIKCVAFVKVAAFVQVICKEKCLDMEFSEFRDQLNDPPAASMNTTVTHGPSFGQDQNQVVMALRVLGNCFIS